MASRKAQIQKDIREWERERERRLKEVEKEFEKYLNPLYDELEQMESDTVFKKYGFRDGDEVRATPEFLKLIQQKRDRHSGLFTRWTADAKYNVDVVDYDRLTTGIVCEGDGATGLIPFEIIKGMRKAYLEHEKQTTS